MKKRSTLTALDMIIFIMAILAVFLFALTFKTYLETTFLYKLRIASIILGLISLIYFSLRQKSLKQDSKIILLLIIVGLFLTLFQFNFFMK